MARKKNPDMKIVYIALAALGGLGAAYYFTRSKSGSASRLTDDAAAGNGNGTSPLLTNSSYTAQSYTPAPTAGSGVVNHATGAPATPKEKQLGLNWLQALIQKNGTKSIYNPFSESDLATGSFGPKSRAALAKANEVMRAAFAALPSSATKNLFAGGVEGDAALQALVDNVTMGAPSMAPNAAEIQALVKAAGGTVGASIGAATPSPSAAPAARTSLPAAIAIATNTEKPTLFVRPASANLAKGLQRFCNYVARIVDDRITIGNSEGLRAGAENGVLTPEVISAYRHVLMLFANQDVRADYKKGQGTVRSSDAFYPPNDIVASMLDGNQYKTLVALEGGYARLNTKVLDWFNGRLASGISPFLAEDLETAYDEESGKRWRNNTIPDLEVTEDQARAMFPNNTVVLG